MLGSPTKKGTKIWEYAHKRLNRHWSSTNHWKVQCLWLPRWCQPLLKMLVLPTSLNACERNQIVQVCERFISMMHLGELIWKVFFQSERCFNIRPQLSSVPETLWGQYPTEQYSPDFVIHKSRSTTNRFSNPCRCHPSFRPKDGSFEDHWYTLDELDTTPWDRHQSYQEKRKPAMGGSGEEKGADCRSFTFQLASLNFWNLNMTIFHRFW